MSQILQLWEKTYLTNLGRCGNLALDYFNSHGIDQYDNFLQGPLDGQLIFSYNTENWPNGALSKRRGYNSFLGTLDGQQVNSLMWYPQQSGTQMFLYRASGSQLSYSLQGTGQWTLAGGGTITNNARMGYAILNNTFICGDGAGSTRHTSVSSGAGTSFTNTTLAPIGQYFAQYGQRIYVTSGTDSTLTYSSYGSADNWGIATPADSSSFQIPDAGANGPLINAGNRLVIHKTSGKMFNWDTNTLTDMTTLNGAQGYFTPDQIDGLWFWINQYGQFSYDGAQRTVLSNQVQRLFYNRNGLGMSGTQLGTVATGQAHIWNYFVTMGSVQDDFTGIPVNNAILNYDYQKDTHHLWQFNDYPTAMLSYIDANTQRQFIFGNSSGQCFQLSGTATSDAGQPIRTEAIFLFTYAEQATEFSQTSAHAITGSAYEKLWKYWRGFFNPGDELNIQFAYSNTLQFNQLKWSEARLTKERGQAQDDWFQVSDGVVEIRFPNLEGMQPRSRFLFLRLYDESVTSKWIYYGCNIAATTIIKS